MKVTTIGRSVEEWVGRTPDDWPPPKAVQRRLYRNQGTRCPVCTRELRAGHITCDHVQPLCMGGANRETNLRLICTVPCSGDKSGEETSRKAKADRWLDRALGLRSKSELKKKARRPIPGSRASPWKRKLDGTVVPRER